MRVPTFSAVILHCLVVLTLAACSTQGNLPETPLPIDTRVQALDAPGPLIDAVRANDQQAFRVALASGAKVNGLYDGKTALQWALDLGRFKFARVLLKAGADWQLGVGPGESSALMKAAEQGQNGVLKQLILLGADIEYQDSQGYSALARAAIAGHLTTMKILINAGANPNIVANEKSLLMHVVEDNNALLSQLLISAGADVNYTAEDGDTALRIARRKGFFDIDLMLVQAGARF
ncbi:MAG: ankyrin repeat domain-containing protein [Oleiphilaceae bacterium]|nr:ankyrin repeat domain-containing protein [Oleiphilaceae bacterium]